MYWLEFALAAFLWLVCVAAAIDNIRRARINRRREMMRRIRRYTV